MLIKITKNIKISITRRRIRVYKVVGVGKLEVSDFPFNPTELVRLKLYKK